MVDLDPRLICANVGRDIWVGHRDACDKDEYPADCRILHIWREDHPGNTCDKAKDGSGRPTGDLSLEYKDGESLENMDKSIEELEEFFKIPGKVYVHCAVGQTRSPTIALIGLAVRGENVYDAVGHILADIHMSRGIVWNICLTPLREILQRYGTPYSKET